MAEYNLFSKIAPYLDKHLIFPLLESMTNHPLYEQNDIIDIKLKLLQSTNMIDYSIEIYNSCKIPVPEELLQKRKLVLDQLKDTKKEAEEITSMLADPEIAELIVKERDYRTLYEKLSQLSTYNFHPTAVEILYKLAKLHFECGNYKYAAEILDSYLSLIPISHANFIAALWGKLASDILDQEWDNALNELKQLKDTIDTRVSNPKQLLKERMWLLHWSLFVYFNHPDGREYLIDLFLYQTPYLNIIQTVCPHLLRYLTAALITSKRKKQGIRDLIKIVKQESYAYTDALLDFMLNLFVECDIQKAQTCLTQCSLLLDADFFLMPLKDECMEAIRQMILEKLCKIHQCLSLGDLATQLNMEVDETETWIANLIKLNRIDAKIDFEKKHLLVNVNVVPPYQRIIYRCRALAYHTQALASMLETVPPYNSATPANSGSTTVPNYYSGTGNVPSGTATNPIDSTVLDKGPTNVPNQAGPGHWQSGMTHVAA